MLQQVRGVEDMTGWHHIPAAAKWRTEGTVPFDSPSYGGPSGTAVSSRRTICWKKRISSFRGHSPRRRHHGRICLPPGLEEELPSHDRFLPPRVARASDSMRCSVDPSSMPSCSPGAACRTVPTDPAARGVEDGFEYLGPGPVSAEPGLDAHPGRDHQVDLEDRFAADGTEAGLGPGSDERFGEVGQFGAVRVQGFEEVDGPCIGDYVDPGFRDGVRPWASAWIVS